jgi:hypothetical protein
MALFSNFDIAAVTGEAVVHNSNVLANDLQPYNDLLFNIISDEIKTRRGRILEHFKTNIKETPGNVRSVSVPLWSYNVRHFLTTRQEYYTELAKLSYMERVTKDAEDRALRKIHEDNGWHWTIGVESSVQYLDEETRWTLRPVPVDLVVRKTDLLQRLSNLFAGQRVWVSREFAGCLHDDDRCRVEKIVLRAHLHVNGFGHMLGRTRALKNTADKYPASYKPYKPFAEFGPAASEKVVLMGPDLAPPKTPPTSAVSTPAAPKASRKRCDSCEYYYDSE